MTGILIYINGWRSGGSMTQSLASKGCGAYVTTRDVTQLSRRWFQTFGNGVKVGLDSTASNDFHSVLTDGARSSKVKCGVQLDWAKFGQFVVRSAH